MGLRHGHIHSDAHLVAIFDGREHSEPEPESCQCSPIWFPLVRECVLESSSGCEAMESADAVYTYLVLT